ncbi:MAG TPA: M91 family zinc metallopeptidase [Allosphingosinicella sp.]
MLDRSPRVGQLQALGASLHGGRRLGPGAPGIAAGGTVQRKLMVAHGSGSESVEEWDTTPKAAGVRGFLAPDQDAVDRMDASRKAFPPPKAAGDGKKVPKWEARGRKMNAALAAANRANPKAPAPVPDHYFWTVFDLMHKLAGDSAGYLKVGATTAGKRSEETEIRVNPLARRKSPYPAGIRLLSRISASPTIVLISPWQSEPGTKAFFNRPSNLPAAQGGAGTGSEVAFGPYAPRETANADGTKAVPAAEVVLGHELVHADRAQRGRTAEGEFSSHHVGGVKHFAPQEELETVGLVPKTHPDDITENDLRAQMKTPLRESYNFGEAARKYTAKANQPKVDAFNAELARLQKATREKAAAQAAAAPAASTPASAKAAAGKPAGKN